MMISNLLPKHGSNQQENDLSIKKVAIYARVSTSEQAEEGYSIDEQLSVLRQWCESQSYTVYDEFTDRGISGKSMNRPALLRMLKEANHFDMVIVWKMNRLARNILDILQMVKLLEDNQVDFRSFKENLETETPAGKLQFHMLAAISEFERDNIAENVKMGMSARAKEGAWNGGRVLGYDSRSEFIPTKKRKQTKLVVNEEEARTVRKIFHLYLDGHGYKSIANQLNKEGFKTKTGNSFSFNSVKTILENPIYVGLIRYNKQTNWSKKRRKGTNATPYIGKGQHDPIISEEVWMKTQERLKQRSKKPNRVHSGEYVLTGIMKCPECGASMVLGRTTNKRKDGTRYALEYYVCGAWKSKGSTVCRSNGVRVDYADPVVLEKLTCLAENKQLVKDIVERINTRHYTILDPLIKENEQLERKGEQLNHEKQQILELYKEGILSKVDFQSEYNKLNEAIDQNEAQIKPIKNQILNNENSQTISPEKVTHTLRQFLSFYKQSGTAEQRKYAMQLMVKKITIAPNRKIETIQVQFNRDLISTVNKEGEPSNDDGSPSFIVMTLNL
ncbi:recombinase family protein [Shouchella miscanthi]|uniref:Recombinase family protein n=1 Tax=Shouchella miscanthi TaxID=2598861 RepID=A0ABU6NS19_9BACI|nr:recombinase family protein [Shouchella miscanthi]